MTTHDADFPVDRARELVGTALDEDLGPGGALDVTTLATIPAGQTAAAQLVARAPGVVAGMQVVDLVLSAVAERLEETAVEVQPCVDDGQGVGRGDVLATLSEIGRAHV